MQPIQHAAPWEIEEGRAYRVIFGPWLYKVQAIRDIPEASRQVDYLVIGGSEHESLGRTTVLDFCRRVRAETTPRRAEAAD